MNITEKQYNKWLNLARVICPNERVAQDTLHDLLLNIEEKKIDDLKINDNYIFISLKNRFLTNTKKESKYVELMEGLYIYDSQIDESEQGQPSNCQSYDNLLLESTDIDYHSDLIARLEREEQDLERLDSIKCVLATLKSYEFKLWTLHFVHGISQRQISRETGIGLNAINKRINKIKNKIKETHEKRTKKG